MYSVLDATALKFEVDCDSCLISGMSLFMASNLTRAIENVNIVVNSTVFSLHICEIVHIGTH